MPFPSNYEKHKPLESPLQILAPAKSLEVAQAAIQAGADAVYIGAPRFGAREAAGNSLDDIAKLVVYAHAFGVKVLVTLNTLLRPDETEEAFRLAVQLHGIEIDALIVQDMQLAALLFKHVPDLRLHASTQCDNRTAEHVAQLRDMGFKRVVLARELSISEIRSIHESVPDIELEAFVHGALCVSYSGRCYMSEELLGRSANRGCCAQMCRMRYDLLDGEGKEIHDEQGKAIHQRYLLSLQDLDRSAYLKELIDAGVTTFKIEGRLKDAAYVTNITAYYRSKLDAIINSNIPIARTFTPNPAKTFHRGATDYFLHGRTRPLANWQTPKSTGETVGTVVRLSDPRHIVLRLEENVVLNNGDGLCIGEYGFSVNGLQVQPKGDIEVLTNTPITDKSIEGQRVSRNHDSAFIRTLNASRRVPVDVIFEETERGYRLCYRPLDRQLAERSKEFEAAHTAASNTERAMATMQEQLTKLGDSIYKANSFQYKGSVIPFLPISVLNAWRRDVTSLAEAKDIETAIPEIEVQAAPAVANEALMTCRYCLLYEMGHCRKENPLTNEPKYIRLANGTTLRLHFDCRQCEMQILK